MTNNYTLLIYGERADVETVVEYDDHDHRIGEFITAIDFPDLPDGDSRKVMLIDYLIDAPIDSVY